jgi:hypothetical protein
MQFESFIFYFTLLLRSHFSLCTYSVILGALVTSRDMLIKSRNEIFPFVFYVDGIKTEVKGVVKPSS